MDVLKIAKFATVFCNALEGVQVTKPPGGADGNLFTNWADDGALDAKTFVKYHGPYNPEKNEDIFERCKARSDSDEMCKDWMNQFKTLSDRYMEDREGGKDFDDSMLVKPLKACEEYLEDSNDA